MKTKALLLLIATVAVSVAHAAPTLFVTVKPILVANTDGSNLSPDLRYVQYANKIYAQADIQFNFLDPVVVNNTTLNNWDINNNSLFSLAGNGASTDPLTINAWFVDTVIGSSVYGFAQSIGGRNMVMDTTNIAGYSALGRVDTFSHELGHCLGLSHTSVSNQLICSGGLRDIPQSLGDVAPDGQNLDLLTTSQIATVRSSQYAQAVPEPVSMVALVAGAAVLARRRRSA